MRYTHTYLQFVAVFAIAWAIAQLTHNWAWGCLFVGVAVLAWSIMAELAKPRKRDNRPNLREVA